MDTIKFCLKNEITKVHCLFIFAAFGERINDLDKRAFKIYLDMFDNNKIRIAFCVTKCEGHSEIDCENIIKDLKNEEYFSKVIGKENVKIFFTGCVNKFMLENSSSEEILINHYKDIHKRREKMIKYIFESNDDGVMLLELPIINVSLKSMKDIFDIQNSILDKLLKITDFKTGTTQEIIQTFSSNVEYMIKNDGLFTNKEMYDLFVKMKHKMLDLKLKMDTDSWVLLSSKIVF